MSTAGSRLDRARVGRWRPQTSSSSVDFPQPLGPTTATTSPAATRRPSGERHDVAERPRHVLHQDAA